MRKSCPFLTVILTAILLISNCKKNITDEEIETGTVTDIDGNVYQTVKIGTQWWMAENLKVTHYRNGDIILRKEDNTTWVNLTMGACCNYDNNSNNVHTYGKLYNWYAVDDNHNIAPEGWHVPSDEDWQILIEYLGGKWLAGGKMKETGTTHWEIPNEGATNESGFSALPSGYRNYHDGRYDDLGFSADFWSSSESESNDVWTRGLWKGNSWVARYTTYKQGGYSVRCVKN